MHLISASGASAAVEALRVALGASAAAEALPAAGSLALMETILAMSATGIIVVTSFSLAHVAYSSFVSRVSASFELDDEACFLSLQ